jgi:glycosyltransferase involved in cell wall biosynthesis
MKVLHVFQRLDRGGAELRTIELVERLNCTEITSDFLVLSGKSGTLDDRVRCTGGAVVKCRLDWLFLFRLFWILRRSRYDIVHSHVHYFSGVVLAVAWLAGVRGRIAHFRSAVVHDKPRTLRRLVQIAITRTLVDWAATHILSVGEAVMEHAWGPQWRNDGRCRVVHNGIAPQRLAVERTQPRAPTMVCVGSLQPLKNQLRVVSIFHKCLSRVPEAKLILIGRDVAGYREQILAAVEERRLSRQVDVLGELHNPLAIVASANLMIVASKWEGLPGAALEACALGTPVLASDLPGTREIAKYFPYVRLLPLDQSDDEWAIAALQMMHEGKPTLDAVQVLISASPFDLERSARQYRDIWTEAAAASRATARVA